MFFVTFYGNLHASFVANFVLYIYCCSLDDNEHYAVLTGVISRKMFINLLQKDRQNLG